MRFCKYLGEYVGLVGLDRDVAVLLLKLLVIVVQLEMLEVMLVDLLIVVMLQMILDLKLEVMIVDMLKLDVVMNVVLVEFKYVYFIIIAIA